MALKKQKDFKETDLYPPIHKWLINQGFEVQAEVKSCDIIATKEDEITIIELKKSFNMQLVYQCIERQKVGKYVYAAVGNINKGKRSKNLKNMIALLKRLGIGLIHIKLYQKSSLLEVLLEPKELKLRSNNRKKKAILKELDKRSGDYNVGGQQGKIVTSYREQALLVYHLLNQLVEASPAQLIKAGGPKNTGNILRDNHYGWFYKISRGKYTFDIDQKEIRKEYGLVLDHIMEDLNTPT